MTTHIPKTLSAALLSAFIFSSVANAKVVTKDVVKKENKIESIRIVPKQDRGIASEDDGFIPLMKPKPSKKAKKVLAK